MTTFADFVSQLLQELGLQQKEVADAWQRRMGAGEVSTYETKLSKVLNDDEEGYGWLLDKKDAAKRMAALAECLGVEPKHLQVLCEGARHRKTLVLHPRLPVAQQAFF